MPRLRSSSIQSLAAARCFLRAVTEPANWTAPPYSRNFSVSVVLPASGCEIIANVRRRAISSVISSWRIVVHVKGRGRPAHGRSRIARGTYTTPGPGFPFYRTRPHPQRTRPKGERDRRVCYNPFGAGGVRHTVQRPDPPDVDPRSDRRRRPDVERRFAMRRLSGSLVLAAAGVLVGWA